MLTFRLLENNDYKKYLLLMDQFSSYKYSNLSYDDFIIKYNIIKSQNAYIYLGFYENILVSACRFNVEEKFGDPVIKIEDVIVDKHFRKQNIGKNMLKFTIEKAKEFKPYKIILNCKEELIPFYESCDFKKEGSFMIKI